MIIPPTPTNEADRLAALRGLHILDTPGEERFDRITRLAMRLFNVPIVLISLVDTNRQWFKSCYGLGTAETSRDVSFCAHAILYDQIFIIPDALQDVRFADNPLVTGDPYIRFYAGQPLHAADGSRVGTLCIIDRQPHVFEQSEIAIMRDLGAIIENELNATELNMALLLQRQVEAALRENQAQLQDFFDNATDLVQIVDKVGRFVYINRAWQAALGYSLEELRGKYLIDIVHPEDREWALGEFGYALAGGKTEDFELRLLTKAGQPVWIAGSTSFSYKDGKPYQLRSILHNLTVRKQTELKLIEAREAALEASRLKSEFLASMSHEIRTPLNAIIGLADLLWETPLNTEQHEYVNIFRRAGTTLLDLINDILDLSKIEAGHFDLEQIDFDLNDLLEKTIEVLAVKAHEKHLELACRVAPDVPVDLVGDPHRLRQIVVNLLGNAIKFTERGEVVLLVERDPHATTPGTLRFSISDTGIGILAEKQAAIFDSFSQVDSSTTRKYGGTGLGLTISKRLVEMMHGQIWVESQPGLGSTFYFTAIFGVQATPTYQSQTAPADLNNLRVLVVDDNSTNRLILREMLSARGAIVHEASDGVAALAAWEQSQTSQQPYQLVLLDCRMPGMDGFEVCERLRKGLQLSEAVVMMLTSDNRRGDISRMHELGMQGYLVKPVKQAELMTTLSAALNRASSSVRHNEPLAAAPLAANRMADGEHLRILLVEDSSDNRLLIKVYLSKTLHELDMAENGAEGVAKFKSGNYDLVLMDMQMPVMDGYTATQQIRQWEAATARLPVSIVALTAYALQAEAQKSLDAGCTAHITKPIKKAALLEMLTQYAQRGIINES